jgi:hypothetical protein
MKGQYRLDTNLSLYAEIRLMCSLKQVYKNYSALSCLQFPQTAENKHYCINNNKFTTYAMKFIPELDTVEEPAYLKTPTIQQKCFTQVTITVVLFIYVIQTYHLM